MKTKPYYLIIGRDNKDSKWVGAWGAYTRKECSEEIADQRRHYKYCKIIKCVSGISADIEAAIKEANEVLSTLDRKCLGGLVDLTIWPALNEDLSLKKVEMVRAVEYIKELLDKKVQERL